jgi:hypothetical protein
MFVFLRSVMTGVIIVMVISFIFDKIAPWIGRWIKTPDFLKRIIKEIPRYFYGAV